MAITRFPNKSSSKVTEEKMSTSVIAAPASAPTRVPSLESQISALRNQYNNSPEGSTQREQALRALDRLIFGV
jgi:hypothetical protein